MFFDFVDAIDQAVAESKLNVGRQKISQIATLQLELIESTKKNGRVRKERRKSGALEGWGHALPPLHNGNEWDKLVEEDVVTPSQFHEKNRIRTTAHALMGAVLEDALVSIEQNSRRRNVRETRLFQEDMEWVMSDDTHYIFSFEIVCQHLDIDADCIRMSLKKRFPDFYTPTIVC